MASRGEDERAEHVEDDDGGVLLVFVAGVVMGAIEYSQRSSIVEPHRQGANAIPAHLVLAGVAVVLFIGLPRLRWARRAPSSIWVAPFSQSGLDRLKLSIRPSSRSSPVAVWRAILVVVLTIAFLYNFLRAGEQVIGGLDPNFTVNTWGGPGYFGAMFAHYLDALYLLSIEAFLLNLVLLREPGR
jgi:hypothetical protein